MAQISADRAGRAQVSAKLPTVITEDMNMKAVLRQPALKQLDAIFGRMVSGPMEFTGGPSSVRDTNQYALGQILLYRFSTSRHCVTSNPREADLFFVPVLTKPKAMGAWAAACPTFNSTMLLAHLPHLTEKTACRHVFAVGKGHNIAKACDWWRRPTGLLSHAVRLSYSYALDKGADFGSLADEPPKYTQILQRAAPSDYPGLVSVPYPSSVHLTAARGAHPNRTGWQSQDRSPLMLFVGDARHGDVPVRSRIHRQCLGYANKSICQSHLPGQNSIPTKLIALKGTSTFCLEPGGDSPFRKTRWERRSRSASPFMSSSTNLGK